MSKLFNGCVYFVFLSTNSVIGEEAEKHRISIHTIMQHPSTNTFDSIEMDCAIITEAVLLSQVVAFVDAIAAQTFAKSRPVFMPII
jgi:hypothetical protein